MSAVDRLDVDMDNYKVLDSTKAVTLLASTLKLFFRELPEPLIAKETRDRCYRRPLINRC